MELLQLKYFQVVARNEHIAKSAKELNVSQPAISLMISRLEHELGVQLFDRIGRNIVLNEYGRAFLEHVESILQEEQSAVIELTEMSKNTEQNISIAMTSPHMLDGIILPFIKYHPDIKLQLRIGDITHCTNLLKSGTIDFCISAPGIWDKRFDTILCRSDKLVAVASIDHPFANQNSVTMEEIAKERIITLVGDFAFRKLVDDIFKSYGFSLNYYIECNHTLRNRLVEINSGITISLMSVKDRRMYNDNVVLLPIRGENIPDVPITLCTPKGRLLSKAAKKIIDETVTFYRSIEYK